MFLPAFVFHGINMMQYLTVMDGDTVQIICICVIVGANMVRPRTRLTEMREHTVLPYGIDGAKVKAIPHN